MDTPVDNHIFYDRVDQPDTDIQNTNDDVSILNRLMTAQKDAMHMTLLHTSDFAHQHCLPWDVENAVFRDDLCHTWRRLSEAERRIDELESQVRLNCVWQAVSSSRQILDDLNQNFNLFNENLYNLFNENVYLKEHLRNVTEENKLLREMLIQKEMNMLLLEKEKRELKADLDSRANIQWDIGQAANKFSRVSPSEVEVGSYECTCGLCYSEEAS